MAKVYYFVVVLILIHFQLGCLIRKDRYLIPTSFKGKMTIVFDQKDGVPEEYEGEWRIFRVPGSGVLFTKHKYYFSAFNAEFYYVDGRGNRNRIWSMSSLEESGLSGEALLDTVSAHIIGGGGSYESPKDTLRINSIYIGTHREFSSRTPQQLSKEFDKLVDEIDKFFGRTKR